MKTLALLWILAGTLWVPGYDEEDALQAWIQYFEDIGCDNIQVRWDCTASYPWSRYWWCFDFIYYCQVFRHSYRPDQSEDPVDLWWLNLPF